MCRENMDFHIELLLKRTEKWYVHFNIKEKNYGTWNPSTIDRDRP